MNTKTVSKKRSGGNPARIKAAILKELRARGKMTFADVARISPDPDYRLWIEDCGRNVIWRGISADARQALLSLRDCDLIDVVPCDPAAYGDDRPDMPVAMEGVAYRDADHWVPRLIIPGNKMRRDDAA